MRVLYAILWVLLLVIPSILLGQTHASTAPAYSSMHDAQWVAYNLICLRFSCADVQNDKAAIQACARDLDSLLGSGKPTPEILDGSLVICERLADSGGFAMRFAKLCDVLRSPSVDGHAGEMAIGAIQRLKARPDGRDWILASLQRSLPLDCALLSNVDASLLKELIAAIPHYPDRMARLRPILEKTTKALGKFDASTEEGAHLRASFETLCLLAMQCDASVAKSQPLLEDFRLYFDHMGVGGEHTVEGFVLLLKTMNAARKLGLHDRAGETPLEQDTITSWYRQLHGVGGNVWPRRMEDEWQTWKAGSHGIPSTAPTTKPNSGH